MTIDVVHSDTFTPTDSGTVLLTAIFDLRANHYDFGSGGVNSRLFITQSGITRYSGKLSFADGVYGSGGYGGKASFSMDYTFSVAAGSVVTYGLAADYSGPYSGEWTKISLVAQLMVPVGADSQSVLHSQIFG